MAYLGYVIHDSGVEVDVNKIKAIVEWPITNSAKALKGFLELARYYRKFIKDYGQVATPLTSLLKKMPITRMTKPI